MTWLNMLKVERDLRLWDMNRLWKQAVKTSISYLSEVFSALATEHEADRMRKFWTLCIVNLEFNFLLEWSPPSLAEALRQSLQHWIQAWILSELALIKFLSVSLKDILKVKLAFVLREVTSESSEKILVEAIFVSTRDALVVTSLIIDMAVLDELVDPSAGVAPELRVSCLDRGEGLPGRLGLRVSMITDQVSLEAQEGVDDGHLDVLGVARPGWALLRGLQIELKHWEAAGRLDGLGGSKLRSKFGKDLQLCVQGLNLLRSENLEGVLAVRDL